MPFKSYLHTSRVHSAVEVKGREAIFIQVIFSLDFRSVYNLHVAENS